MQRFKEEPPAMPATTYLHIQPRDAAPARVLEIPWGSVRIGRGEQCEVRLGEPALADVQCMLRRRGEDWQLQPVGPPGRISIAGRAVEQTRSLPMGTAFRIGEHWLTLRPAEAPAPAPEAWGTLAPPDHPRPGSLPAAAAVADAPDEAEGDRLRHWQERLEHRERWLKTRLDERRWEARWKAAGAGIKARSAAAAPAAHARPTPDRPQAAARLADARPVDASFAATQAPPVARVVGRPRSTPPRLAPGPAPRPVVAAPLGEIAPVIAAIEATPIEDRRLVPESAPAVEDVAVGEAGTAVAEPAADAPSKPKRGRRAKRATLGVASTAPTVEEFEPDAAPPPAPPGLDLGAILQLMMGGAMAPPAEPAESFVEVVAVIPPLADLEPLAKLELELEPEPAAIEVAIVPRTEVFEVVRPILSLPAPAPEPVAAVASAPAADEVEEVASPAAAESEGQEPGPFGVSAPGDMLEWPSARVVLQQHRVHRAQPTPGPKAGRFKAAGAGKRSAAAGPTPTEAREPGHWTVPALGWLWAPAAAAVAAVGLAGAGLAWTWARDDQAAGTAADRIFDRPAPLGVEEAEGLLAAMGPEAAWWKTTAGHLLVRAALADRAGAATRDQVGPLLRAAQGAAPAHGAVRLARARKDAAGPDAASRAESLGLPRDAVALAWTGRKLAEAGKVEPALRAYRAALELVSRSEPTRPGPPKFLAGRRPGADRFALPGEDLVEPIVRELAGFAGWSFDRWSAALPAGGVAPLVAARVLRESASPDAEKAADLASAGPAATTPLGLAARAEALALKERLEEAEAAYRAAIAAMPDDRTRRAWSLNLAEVCGRQNDDAKRRSAWEAAKAGVGGDEITRRVVEAQARAGLADSPTAATRRL